MTRRTRRAFTPEWRDSQRYDRRIQDEEWLMTAYHWHSLQNKW